MDIQSLINEVEEYNAQVSAIYSNADDKVTEMEDIRERSNDASTALESYRDTLTGLLETLSEVEDIISTAEDLDLT
jgi:DNA repair ATPase RecN